MKARVISALVGLAVLGAVLAIINTWMFNAVIAVISFRALFEMLRATNNLKNRGLAALAFALALLIHLGGIGFIRKGAPQIIFVFLVLFFVLLIKNSQSMRVEQVSLVFGIAVIIPAFFSCGVFLRDLYGPIGGAFYILTSLGSAWFCDTFAFFSGRAFGKHKLAPIVSPKKTVEGAIGGLIGAAVSMLLLAALFAAAAGMAGVHVRVNYAVLALVTPFFGVLGMLGDLSASVIKRQYDVKDYGTIMPGHGGVMDRFDSVLFTLPAVLFVARILPLIELI